MHAKTVYHTSRIIIYTLVFITAVGCCALSQDTTATPDTENVLQGVNITCPGTPVPNKAIVWFVHGMYSTRGNFDKEMEILKEMFPDAQAVELITWDAPKECILKIGKAWSNSIIEADKFAPHLANKVGELSTDERSRLILIGHSLGARIIIKASEHLAAEKTSVRQIILAGAAADNDDPGIAKLIQVSDERVINMINCNDIMLALYKTLGEFSSALGTGYLYVQPSNQFMEIVLDGTVDHYGYRYFEKWHQCIKTNDFSFDGVIVPQDFVQVNTYTLGGYFWWEELDKKAGWRLQQNINTGHCRIIDSWGTRRAWGRKQVLQAAFEKVKTQL